jgi:hypothetical protein
MKEGRFVMRRDVRGGHTRAVGYGRVEDGGRDLARGGEERRGEAPDSNTEPTERSVKELEELAIDENEWKRGEEGC